MGRPYESELLELEDTYSWSLTAPLESLAASIATASRFPLITVGSGGSLTSASVAAVLHMRFSGLLARVMTPYELSMSPVSLGKTGVLLCTAGGSNPDILSCFDSLVRREPGLLAAVCTRQNTPLARAAAVQSWAFCHEIATPVRKDGFLATNSLLATITLLARSYEHVYTVPSSLPSSFAELLNPKGEHSNSLTKLEEDFERLHNCRTLVVLHGNLTQPAAVDIESRFTEAALGNIQLADYRNFAHGRHNWLARRADETGVIMLCSQDDRTVADRTASLLPKSMPVLRLGFSQDVSGMLSAVGHSIYLGWFAAKAQGIDPGRPKVAQFGRRLYHVRSIPKSPPVQIDIPELEARAVERKSRLTVATLHARNQLDAWRKHYRTFSDALTRRSFSGVIFDYDGTLCGSGDRFTGLRKDVISALLSLLRAGILVGIATGRGKSVREELRLKIRQRNFQKQVLIGYHNGGEIGSLDDANVPPASGPLDQSLLEINSVLAESTFVAHHSKIEAKGRQITLEASAPIIIQELYDCVSDAARHYLVDGLQVVQSTHSVDVLASGISKLALLTAMVDRLRERVDHPEVLCVGDRGCWPGNDYALLQHAYALSVDETSHDPSTCWNLAPPGVRQVDACLHYLRHFEAESGVFWFRNVKARK